MLPIITVSDACVYRADSAVTDFVEGDGMISMEAEHATRNTTVGVGEVT